MKVIQRDHRLVGYKLDNVSANLITEKTEKIIEVDELNNGKALIKYIYKKYKSLR